MGFDCRLEEEKLPPPRPAQDVNGVHSGSAGAPVDRGPVSAKRVSFDSKVSQQPGKGRWRKSGFPELQERLWGILPHEYADVLSRKL